MSIKTIAIISIILLSFSAKAAFLSNVDSIYNIDNRELITQESSAQVKKLANSVALIFNSDDLITEHGQQLIFANLLSDTPPVGQNVCSDELFATHHAYRSACSGFLVGEDLLATAGHCFEDQYSCDNQLIAFDVDSDSEINRGFKAIDKNIYRCKEIVSQIYDFETKQDYAVIKLDRKSERTPLKLRTTGKLSLTDKVFMIGHPLGLPLVYSPESEINENSNPLFFKTKINSFHGNSGSPIFNAKTFLVEGILVRGEEDFKMDKQGNCQRYMKYSSTSNTDKLKSEGATRIQFILPFLH